MLNWTMIETWIRLFHMLIVYIDSVWGKLAKTLLKGRNWRILQSVFGDVLFEVICSKKNVLNFPGSIWGDFRKRLVSFVNDCFVFLVVKVDHFEFSKGTTKILKYWRWFPRDNQQKGLDTIVMFTNGFLWTKQRRQITHFTCSGLIWI